MFERAMSQGTRLHDPLGKMTLHDTMPAYPLLQAQAGPATMSEKVKLQAAGLHGPPGELPLQDTVALERGLRQSGPEKQPEIV